MSQAGSKKDKYDRGRQYPAEWYVVDSDDDVAIARVTAQLEKEGFFTSSRRGRGISDSCFPGG